MELFEPPSILNIGFSSPKRSDKELEVFQRNVDNQGMKVSEMELLVRVAETGSMTRSASQLKVTPASVSATVARIEEAIGVRIFERTTRSIHVTDEGLTVLDGCREVVKHWQRTLEEVQGTKRELLGTVHLSAPTDTTYEFLSPVLVSIAEEHPKLQLVVHSSDTVQHIHRDAIDLAIRYGPMQDSSLQTRKLAECPGVLVASPSYLKENGAPLNPEDLDKHRILTLQLSSIAVRSWTLTKDGESQQIPIRSPLCGDGYLARQWAIAGMGIARKSLFDVIGDLESGRLCRVLPAYTCGSAVIRAVFPNRRYLPARVRIVDTAISEAFSAHASRCEAWLSQSNTAIA